MPESSSKILSLNHQDVTVEKMLITPEWAKEAFSRQPDNQRNISQAVRNRYADDMKIGNWQFNGQSIKFDIVGNLLDGQHRLNACIISGISFWSIVVRGLDPQAFYTLDTGRLRTTATILHMVGYMNTNNLSAACNIIIRWHHKYSARKMVSSRMILNFLTKYPSIIESLKAGNRKPYEGKALITQSTLGAFHFIAGYIDKKLRDDFIQTLILGFNEDRYDAKRHGVKYMGINELRERRKDELERKIYSRNIHQLGLLIEVWNHFYKNEPFNYFTYKKDSRLPAIEGLPENTLNIEN